jgi:hypothetical protein
MLVTYAVKAILVTFYLSVLLSLRSDKMRQTLGHEPWVSRTLMAVQHSTATFIGASFVFSIAMLLASQITSVTVEEQSLSGATLATWVLATVMSISSVLQIVQLQLAASGMLRRGKGRASCGDLFVSC